MKYLLLTHIHSDHINATALRNIRKSFPHIIVIGNYEVAQHYEIDHIINAGYPLDMGSYTFEAFECVHDVVTYGYTWDYNEHNIIYATDTNTLEHAPIRKYDYLFLESNYDPIKLELARGQRHKYGYDAYAGGLRHLSTNDCKAFYFMNRRSNTSELIELHQSSRFY